MRTQRHNARTCSFFCRRRSACGTYGEYWMSFCPYCCGAPATCTADGQWKTQTPGRKTTEALFSVAVEPTDPMWSQSKTTESLRSVAVERTIEWRYAAYEALHNRSIPTRTKIGSPTERETGPFRTIIRFPWRVWDETERDINFVSL